MLIGSVIFFLDGIALKKRRTELASIYKTRNYSTISSKFNIPYRQKRSKFCGFDITLKVVE